MSNQFPCGWFICIPYLLLAAEPNTDAAEPLAKIELEIATHPSADVMAQRRWYEHLKDLKLGGLRLRQAREGEGPSITERRRQPGYYQVTGILTPSDRLELTGASFQRRDLEGLKRYLIRIVEQGIDGATAPRGTFGLTERQFRQIHADLIQPIGFETKDQSITEIIKRLEGIFALAIDSDASAANALDRQRAGAELQGFTAGTGLAILLHQKGLAFRPAIEQGQLKHHVYTPKRDRPDAPNGMTCWPVGHEPPGQVRRTLPIIFEQLNVQIEGYTLIEALDALQARIKVPFLYDHVALAEANIDPGKIEVRFPAMRTYYKRVLDNILLQAKLKGDLRVDEAGKPFYWISTRGRSRRGSLKPYSINSTTRKRPRAPQKIISN